MPEHRPTVAETWDSRYEERSQVWSGAPNGALVAGVRDLPAGAVLDVGCGEGADAVWLARARWTVTAIDPSAVALGRARVAAEAAGVEVRWIHAGLGDAPLPAGAFDLVSVQYPALLEAEVDVRSALLPLVAPGGRLLVVHHADVDREHALARGFDPDDYVGHDDVLAALGDDWRIEVDERRPRVVDGGSGAGHTHDLVLRARRPAD